METKTPPIKEGEVKVTVHIPEKVSETIRQQKINMIYDLLAPKKIKEST